MSGFARICCIPAVSLLLAASAMAQDDIESYDLGETVVTATRKPDTRDNVPQPVSVVTGEEIRNLQAYNAGDVLDFVPGVRIIRAGTVGEDNGISIRSLNGGPSSNKTLVLLDGRPVNDAWSSGVNLSSIPAEMIDRIEVVRGPGSALYGSQATGGIVSIFTKSPAPGFHGRITVGREFNASADIDDNTAKGYGRAEVSASRVGLDGSFGTERTGHFLSLGYRMADQSFPTTNENSWDNYDIFYKIDHDLNADADLRFSFSAHNDTWDNAAERIPGEIDRDVYSADLYGRWLKGPGAASGRVYVNRNESRETVYASNLKTGNAATRAGVIADYSLPLTANDLFIGGIDAYFDQADVDYDRTVVSMTYRGVDAVNIRNAQSGAVSTVQADTFSGVYGDDSQSYNDHNLALFGQYTRLFGESVNLVLGGRLDIHSEFGSVFSPKAGVTWDVLSSGDMVTTMKANYGTAFRAPSMWSLFSQSTTSYGDPDLEPEITRNTDIGVFQRFGSWGTAELTLFHMDVSNLMINDKLGSTGDGYYAFVTTTAGVDTLTFNQQKNLGSYSPKGAEIGFSLRPHRQVSVSGAYTFLDPGDFTFQTSRHRWNLGLSGFIPLGDRYRLEGNAVYNFTGDGYFFDYETRPFDSFATTDARIGVSYGDLWSISLTAKNLMDKEYQLWHYAWQPGRTISLTFESGF